jgi:MFS family permease
MMSDAASGSGSRAPRDDDHVAAGVFAGAYAKSCADWERWFIKTPRPSGKSVLLGYCLGALEGAILGFLQARWDGAVFGAFFGLPIGFFSALVRWRIRKDIRRIGLALFLGLLVEVVGISVIAGFVHLPFFVTMVRTLSGMKFVKMLLVSIAQTVPIILLVGWLFVSQFRANLRRSALAGILGASLGAAVLLVLAVLGSLAGVISGYLVPVLLLESPLAGAFFGFIGGVSLVGAVSRLIDALTRITRQFRRDDLDSQSSDRGYFGTAVAAEQPVGGVVARAGLPDGQEPLPAWIPQRIQGLLWELWIQSHWWPVKRRR